MGDTRPCSDPPKKSGDRRVLFSPRKGAEGEPFSFRAGVTLVAGLCYDESEIPANLLATLVKQGSARYVEPEKPKPLPKKVEKSRKRLLDELRGDKKDSEGMVSSEGKEPGEDRD